MPLRSVSSRARPYRRAGSRLRLRPVWNFDIVLGLDFAGRASRRSLAPKCISVAPRKAPNSVLRSLGRHLAVEAMGEHNSHASMRSQSRGGLGVARDVE